MYLFFPKACNPKGHTQGALDTPMAESNGECVLAGGQFYTGELILQGIGQIWQLFL